VASPQANAPAGTLACTRPRAGGRRCRSRSKCSTCGTLWAGDTRRKLLANISAYGGAVSIITVTAPGADVLPWDDSGRRIRPAERYRWNRTAPQRWRELHRAASQIARRRCGRFSMLARTWEYQARGALHVHVVAGVETADEMAAANVYAQALTDLARAHGFGFVDRGKSTNGVRHLEIIPAARAARYVAKYLSPLSADGKPMLSETVTQPDVPPHVAYVSTKLTLSTGITMRYLRWCRHAYFLGIDARTGEVLERGEVVALVSNVALTPPRGP